MSRHNIFSKVAILFIAVIFLLFLHRYTMWKTSIISGGDGWGYYMYLPAAFIYGDLNDMKQSIKKRVSYHGGFASLDKDRNKIEEAPMHEGGRRVMKYTLGLAILYSPFFLLAHFLALLFDYPADGYSPIYIYTMHLATLFFTVMGLVLLRKVLLNWLSDKLTAITLVAVALGTNLYHFTVYNSMMAHAYLFFLYALLIYATQKWYSTSRTRFAVLVGLAAGFITLIRPTEIICLIIPLLWGVTSWQSLLARFRFIGTTYKSYLWSVLAYILAGLPQLIYWKWASGDWLYYSYREEGFDFKNPHLLEGLFGFRNGWLAYTPMMILAIIGIWYLGKKKHPAFLPILIYLPIQVYITYSWWCWNYINGMGSRPMVETYALLIIPLAFFLQRISKRHLVLKALIFILFGFFVFQNMFQTEQVKRGVLWPEDSNWAFYKRSFAKTKLDYLDLLTFDTKTLPPDESDLKYVRTIFENNFEDSLSVFYQTQIPGNDSRVYRLDNNKKFSPNMNLEISKIPDIQSGDWIKVSIDAMRQYEGNFMYRMSSLVVAVDPGKEWIATRIDNKLGRIFGNLWSGKNNVWDNVYIWMQIPKDIESSDKLKTYVWNDLAEEIFIDNMKVEIWRQAK